MYKIKKKKKKENNIFDINSAFEETRRMERKAMTIRGPLQTIENITLKCMEELGELATDILKLKKFKVTDELPKDIMENMEEEVVDGLIMYMTITENLNMDTKKVLKIFRKKLKKWEKNHLDPNNQ